MEAALSRALSAVDSAISDRSKMEAGCRGCVPCLFQDCGQRTGTCGRHEHTHFNIQNSLTLKNCEVVVIMMDIP